MNLLIVGADNFNSLENLYFNNLKKLDVNILNFPAHTLFTSYYNRNLFNKIIFKSGFSSIYSSINLGFKTAVEQLNPDVIWIFKGMEISPDSLRWASSRGIKLVNFNPDNPFIFSGEGSGNMNITNSISLYDYHFTYNLSVKRKFDELNLKSYFLPFGFELSDGTFERIAEEDEILSTCFVGNPDKARVSALLQLAESGVKIDLYGHLWKNFISHPKIRLFPAVFGDEFWKILRKYRVQINLMRPHNHDSHNMRTFELPAIGGIMVAPKTSEHQLFFKDKSEAFFFSSLDECVEIVKSLLNLSLDEANSVRNNARNRSINSGYSYSCRSQFVLEILKSSVSNQPY